MIRLLALLIPVACFGLGYYYCKLRMKDPLIIKLREHSKYLRKARWASMTRRDGLVNIYTEAADRVLELPESRE